MTSFRPDADFARDMDAADPLASFRQQFHIPKAPGGGESIYLCGNSLGLQPKGVAAALQQELEDWKTLGVEGHFHAKNPWLPAHEDVSALAAELVGAEKSEVVMMNGLTVNLHLMMASFYRPTAQRHKILIEHNPFPSDRYAIESQIRYHGFDPAKSLVELHPRQGEETLNLEDVEHYIGAHGKDIALILMGGVHYYTGQLFNLERIARVGFHQGCVVGFDLAHAVGNVPLKLHDWGVDFAAWCSYKYLNSGPGSVAGCFVHSRHAENFSLPRFAGWWGHDKTTRFKMGPNFQPMQGAEGWQLSNPPILALAASRVSLQLFKDAGMKNLRDKSVQLTGYLEYLLKHLNIPGLAIITPENPSERGCQLSLTLAENGRAVFDALTKAGVICDWREPDCIRVAPVPLYNSFTDVYKFAQVFAAAAGNKLQEAV
ncbi:MAG: kynureninase [Micavibrio sp.]|nr:kynureninase [Micavibrio sp.]